jgi:hypothetical protein
MMRTLRIGKVELDSARGHADGHDPEDEERPASQPRLAKGTPWRMAVPRPLGEEHDPDLDDDGGPLPPVGVEVELGTRTRMEIGAWSAPRATPDAPSSQAAIRAVIDAAASARWAIAYRSREVTHAPPVQPLPEGFPLDSAEPISDRAASPAAARPRPAAISPGARVLGVLLLAVAAAAFAAYVTTTVF